MKLKQQTSIEVNPQTAQVTKLILRTAITIGFGAAYGFANAMYIVNGNFEQMPNWGSVGSVNNNTHYFLGNQIPGWTIGNQRLATIHLSGNPAVAPTISGEYSLNTDGEGYKNHNVDIWQDFATVSGTQYTLTYQWKSWLSSANRVKVLVHDPNDINIQLVANTHSWINDGGQVHNESQTFTSNGSPLRLHIFHDPELGVNDNSFIMDNFAINTAPVPEPGTMLAVGGGIAALLRRCRKK